MSALTWARILGVNFCVQPSLRHHPQWMVGLGLWSAQSQIIRARARVESSPHPPSFRAAAPLPIGLRSLASPAQRLLCQARTRPAPGFFRAKSEAWSEVGRWESEVGIPTSVGERSWNSDLGGLLDRSRGASLAAPLSQWLCLCTTP